MFTDPLFLLTATVAMLLLGLAKGGFAGVGMAAAPLLSLYVPPLQALAITLPVLMMQDIVSLWWYRRDYDAWNLKVMIPGAVIGTGVAWALGSAVSEDVTRLIIGVIGVGFVLHTYLGRRAAAGPAERARRRVLGRLPRPSRRPSRRPGCRHSPCTCCRSGWRR